MTTFPEYHQASRHCLALASVEFAIAGVLAFIVQYTVAIFFFLAGLAFAAVAWCAFRQMNKTRQLDELFVRRIKDPEHAAYWGERADELLEKMR